MKKFLICLIVFLAVPTISFAGEYNDYLNSFDLSFVDELSSDVKDYLCELGVDNFSYDSLVNLSIGNVYDVIKSSFINQLKSPIKACLVVLVFVLLSALFKNLNPSESTLSSIYSTISAIAIGITLLVEIGNSINLAKSTLSIASNFIFAFIPTFCAIIAAGGGIATSFSTNTTLLLLAQGLSFISSNLFMPIINSFLALSICSGIRSELNLASLLSTIKRMLVSTISVVSAMFVSILSIKTSVSARSDILGIRSVRFVINSVVPIIGGSISEGLLSIQSYSSLIKSSVGIVGIIAVALVFLPSIIEVVVWRISLSVCSIASDLFCDKSVSKLINSFRDTLLLINVVQILSLVTTIISIGILIASRTV